MKVTDANTNTACSNGDTVTVDPALVAGAITPSTPTIDSGQSVTLTAHPSGGTNSYTYQWYSGSSATCSSDTTMLGTSATQVVSPTSGTYYCYSVSDTSTNPPTVRSATDQVSVDPALAAGAVTPSSPTIDSGQSVTLTSHASGGTGVYTYQWYSGSSSTCTSDVAVGGATSVTYSPSPTSSTYYCYSVTDTSTNAPTVYSATDQVTVGSTLSAGAITPSSPTIDSGQSVTLTAHPSGGTGSYTYQWYSGSSPTCSSDVTTLGTALTQVVSPTSNTYYCYTVSDTSTNPPTATSATDLVTVDPALVAGAITPSTPTIDSGQSVTLTAHPSGGTNSYTYQWYSGSSATCSSDTTMLGTSATQVVSPTSNTNYCYSVTDSSTNAPTVSSATDQVLVNSALTAGAITPSSPTIDNGQSVTLTTHASGGTGFYTYQWYSGSSATCSSDTTTLGTASTQVVSPSTSTYYCYSVTDTSTNAPTVYSATDQVAVDSSLSAGAITPSTPTIDSGRSVTLTAHASGGTGSYTYQWYSGSSPTCSSDVTALGTSSTQVVSPTSNTYYCYSVSDTSTNPPTVSSATNQVSVDPALSAGAITPSGPTINSGQSVTLTAHPSGGTGSYTYQWYAGSSSTCSSDAAVGGATSPTYAPSPTSNTYYCYSVTDTSTNAPTVSSATDLVTVNGPLSAGTISPPSPTIDNGQSVTLTANPSGGTGPYTYQWYTSSDCSTSPVSGATSSIYAASPTSTTTYYVLVTDSATPTPATSCSSGDTVTVDSALSAGAITPSSPTIDSGQSVTLTAHPSGGTNSYTYQWYSGSSATCSSDTTTLGTAFTQVVSPTSGTYYCYSVTDTSTNAPTVSSASDLVTVNLALSAGAITPSAPTIDSGRSVTLTAHASGGTGIYTYQWYSGSSATCSSDITTLGTSSTQVVSPTSNTYYCYSVTDTSTNPPTVTSSTDLVTVDSALTAGAITPASPTISSGSPVTLTAHPSGGTNSYTYQWYSGSSATCSSDTAVGGQTSSTYTPSPTSNTYYCYTVSDTSTNAPTVSSPTDLVTVTSGLVAGTISPSSPTIDNGQSVTLAANPSGGTTPYTYQWYTSSDCSTSPVSSATASTYNASPTTTTTYYVKVTDANSNTACSAGDLVTVDTALAAGAVTPGTPTIDSGQSVTLTAHASGGTGTYTYQWYSGSSATCSSDITSLGTASTQVVSPTSSTYYCYSVSDTSTNPPTVSSSTNLVTVDSALSAGAITPTSPTIDSGQSVTLTAHPSGGTGVYSYQWYSGSSSTCSSDTTALGTSSTQVASPTSSTYYCYSVTDTSTDAPTAVSGTDLVTVDSALSAGAITPANPTIDSGQSVILAAHATGGTGSYTYQWYSGSNPTCSSDTTALGTSSTQAVSPTSGTYYCYSVTDTSTNAPTVSSATDLVTVDGALSAGAVTPATPTIDSGQSVTLTAHPSGGTGTYSYQWYSGTSAACSSDTTTLGTSVTQLVSPVSNTYYCYSVSDTSTNPPTAISATDQVTVNAAISGVTLTPSPTVMDDGQSSTLQVSWSGGTADYTITIYSGSSSTSCASDITQVGSAHANIAASPLTGVSVSPTSTIYYCATVVDGASFTASTSTPVAVTVNPALGNGPITPGAPIIDNGQPVTLTANPTGGTGPDTYQWYTSSDCSTSPVGGATSPTLTTSPTTTTTYYVLVTDSTGATSCSSGDTVTVNPALGAGAITPASPTITSGSSVLLTANPSGGTTAYSYQWYTGAGCTNPIGGATSSTYDALPSSTTTYYYQVTDSASTPASACSAGDTVTVNTPAPLPSLNAGPLSPTTAAIQTGNDVTFTISPTGGTSPYTYHWNIPSDLTVVSGCGPTDASCNVTSSAPGTYSVSVRVTDNANDVSTSSPAVLKVNPTPLTVLVSAPASATLGSPVTFTASVSGGASPYTYSWNVPGGMSVVSGCGLSDQTCTVIAGSPGSYSVGVTVTDSNGATATSSGSVTYSSSLSPGGIEPPSPKIDRGQPITLTITPTGGEGPYTYEWFTGADCSGQVSGTGSSLTVSPSSTTTYWVQVTDATGTKVCVGGDTVTVNGQLVAGPITPSAPSISAGQSVQLSADPSGGTSPYSYQWYTGAGCTSPVPGATSAALSASPSATTVYYYKVTDSATTPESACSPGDAVTVGSTAIVTITPTSGPPGTLIFLSGSNFSPGGSFYYCFEPGVTTSTMNACPSTYQFTSTSSGGVPPLTVLTAFGQSGLVVVSDASTGQIVAYAVFTLTTPPAGSPAITLNPTLGLTGTPVTVDGTGFTPGVTVTIVMSRGTVATATVGPNGTFSATFDVPSSPPGTETVTATGSDVATNPGDVATTTFIVTNVGNYHSDVFPVTSTNGTAIVNETATTGVSITIPGLGDSADTTLRIELANLTLPSYGVSAETFTGAIRYFDVFVVGNGTIPLGLTAHVCITNPIVASGTGMQYWNGSAWVNPSDITIGGTTICGTVPVAGLGGTNFAIGNIQGATTTRIGVVSQISWIWFFILPLLVGSLVFFFVWFFLIAGKRRRKDEEEEFQRRFGK